ncbi:MAG: hypothetical protein ACREIC_11620 [Limisphaerales bacterium]
MCNWFFIGRSACGRRGKDKGMDKEHPHLGATYKIAREINDTFAVEVTFPRAPLVNVKGFATEKLAAAWIADHERQIATGTIARAKLHLWKKGT